MLRQLPCRRHSLDLCNCHSAFVAVCVSVSVCKGKNKKRRKRKKEIERESGKVEEEGKHFVPVCVWLFVSG